MGIIKTFEAYGQPDPKLGKQFSVIKKGKGLLASTFTSEMITSMWVDLINATDYDGVILSDYLKDSNLKDKWENNNMKLTCVQMGTVVAKEPSDQFQISVTGSVSKRVTTYKLNAEDILKTWDGKYAQEGKLKLSDFVNSANSGEKWTSKNIEITKI